MGRFGLRHTIGRVWAVVVVAIGALAGGLSAAAAAERGFPFDHELMLDARPMQGSKRVPSLEIRANGATSIGLWCNNVEGQIVVVENRIVIMTGARTNHSCPAERVRADEDVLSALMQASKWRRDGNLLILEGETLRPVRFRLGTN